MEKENLTLKQGQSSSATIVRSATRPEKGGTYSNNVSAANCSLGSVYHGVSCMSHRSEESEQSDLKDAGSAEPTEIASGSDTFSTSKGTKSQACRIRQAEGPVRGDRN